ncbi:MAG: hypothetical protein IPK10_08035 [Bacteroidetes bacterium]|nr:hypothetical protein [Bacteroidota bacterium]
MNAKLNFNGKSYELESFSVQHQKSGDPSSAKGKGSVEPLRPAVINATIKYKSFNEPPIDNLVKAALTNQAEPLIQVVLKFRLMMTKTPAKLNLKKLRFSAFQNWGIRAPVHLLLKFQ